MKYTVDQLSFGLMKRLQKATFLRKVESMHLRKNSYVEGFEEQEILDSSFDMGGVKLGNLKKSFLEALENNENVKNIY